jgi:alkylation response protein AidB-like acyl-CoA dehydrogenase
VDFSWTDEHQRLRQSAVEFGSARLADDVARRDREGEFSRELWDACAGFGLQGALAPSEFGGAGRDLLSAITLFEGIGCGAWDNGLVFSIAAHAASCEGPICSFGSEAQKREWLPGLASGALIGATGITEPDSGSNALALAATARPAGRDWLLTGTKAFVTNAPVANLFVIYARTGQGFGGLTCFLVARETSGLTIGAPTAMFLGTLMIVY